MVYPPTAIIYSFCGRYEFGPEKKINGRTDLIEHSHAKDILPGPDMALERPRVSGKV